MSKTSLLKKEMNILIREIQDIEEDMVMDEK